MNESDTRAHYIDPALQAKGWRVKALSEEGRMLTEFVSSRPFRAYGICCMYITLGCALRWDTAPLRGFATEHGVVILQHPDYLMNYDTTSLWGFTASSVFGFDVSPNGTIYFRCGGNPYLYINTLFHHSPNGAI